MKRILAVLAALVLIGSAVLGDNPQLGQTEDAGNESEKINTQQQTANQGQETSLTIQQRNQVMAENAEQLREMIQNRQQEMNQESEQLGEQTRAVYQNQNRVRLAVHALLAMENLTGGIGRNVSAIARDFNNSVQATIRAEERIENRNWLTKFFAGGDEEAAEDIELEVNSNQARIQELKRLMQDCECDEEVKAMMQQQIQNMEQEQNRLMQKSQEEKKNKGLFGWLWK